MDEDQFDRTIVSFGTPPGALPELETQGHYLIAIEGDEPGRIIEVGPALITVGRGQGQTLVFPDSALSRLHARMSLVQGQIVVEDMKSTNGTFVNGTRIAGPTPLPEGGLLQIGGQVLKHERRSRRDVERSLDLRRDLMKASNYVLSKLPAPVTSGPVRATWLFRPSAQLGGDAFGYYWLDDDTFVLYLVDVSGHGVGAAMHSVAVMNALRQRTVADDPAAVLSSLNDGFQMDDHGGMFFTIWYGVYRRSDRTLRFGTAGHHAAYLVDAERQAARPLGLPNLMIGAMPGVTFDVGQATVAPGSTLYVFSDGVFEIVTKTDERWALPDFVPHLLAPPVPGTSEPERLLQAVRQEARPGLFDDDFSLVAFAFD